MAGIIDLRKYRRWDTKCSLTGVSPGLLRIETKDCIAHVETNKAILCDYCGFPAIKVEGVEETIVNGKTVKEAYYCVMCEKTSFRF